MLLKQLVEAKFTLISVTTDDPTNIEEALHSLLEDDSIKRYDAKMKNEGVFYSLNTDPNDATIKTMSMNKQVMILVNYQGSHPAVFDAGDLPTPRELIRKLILHKEPKDVQNEVLDAMEGLSYRRSKQLFNLAKVRGIPLSLPDLKNLRFELYGMDEGLYTMPKLDEEYHWDATLKAWADTNLPYLVKESGTLTPRGLLLYGVAGTGKTMAVKALSEEIGVPAYRLDIGASLSKWSGESEARVRKHLAHIEQESPCILLVDEIEKVINTSDEDTISTRILAQLLWWMSEHRKPVLTILTSNDIDKLPKELYREGRCDAAIEIPELEVNHAQKFAMDWVNNFVKAQGKKLTIKEVGSIRDSILSRLSGKEKYSPAVAVEAAKQSIKSLKLFL